MSCQREGEEEDVKQRLVTTEARDGWGEAEEFKN